MSKEVIRGGFIRSEVVSIGKTRFSFYSTLTGVSGPKRKTYAQAKADFDEHSKALQKMYFGLDGVDIEFFEEESS